MKVAIAYDHRGRKSVELVRTTIEQQGHEYLDLGPSEEGAVDCPDFAYVAAMSVANHEADMAILICNTGIGMAMCANKVKGVRAARCCDEFEARAARYQFDANVLCLSGELLGQATLSKIIETWLNCDFEDRVRSRRAICKMRAIEQGRDPRQIVEAASCIQPGHNVAKTWA